MKNAFWPWKKRKRAKKWLSRPLFFSRPKKKTLGCLIGGLFGRSFTIPLRELRKQCPRGSTWQSFHFNMWSRSKNWKFNFSLVIRLFESHENLYPPKGSAKAHPMGSNWFSYSLLSLVNEKLSFNFALVIRQKILVKNLYCEDGRMDGRMDGWTDGQWSKVSIDFPCFDVC